MRNKNIPPEDMLDPDVRFLLANERTLLAWVRTSLTLIAGGIAFIHFTKSDSGAVAWIGIMTILLGSVMSLIGLQRFMRAEIAIRAGRLPATGKGPMIQVLLVILFAAALILLETGRL